MDVTLGRHLTPEEDQQARLAGAATPKDNLVLIQCHSIEVLSDVNVDRCAVVTNTKATPYQRLKVLQLRIV
jgi:hypothetical protein